MSAQVLLIDNYDSFVFNLARYVEELGVAPTVVRNDAVTVRDIQERAPAAVILSPGPCSPNEAGICMELVRELGESVPILGVCLGHQAIAAALGGRVVRAREPVHGRTSLVHHDGTGVFAGLLNPLQVTRYHSLIVEEATMPDSLRTTARLTDGTIMAIAHRSRPIHGVQFHPESILTQCGRRLLGNFLRLAGIEPANDGVADDLVDAVDNSADFYRRPIDPRAYPPG